MKVTVLFFALCREITEEEKIEIEIEEKETIKELVSKVVKKYPKMDDLMKNMVLSVNLEYKDPNSEEQLKANDEIAFIPPISGG
mmetsp:Transcript_45851/g.73756  ORF Transcript_45851/g.73756 Transcript_45851/m.73756 type:complete len:84 (-) Transcript_45851:116-367(-)|eukprot:jgi/Bigna1/37645/e_gw1.21.145.1